MNPIHQIADGRLRLLAAVVKVTGIPEAEIIGDRRSVDVISARRIIDHALFKLGWHMNEIADAVYGSGFHSSVLHRLRKPLTPVEQDTMIQAMTLSESRPTMPTIRQPAESVQRYIVRVVAYHFSVDACEVFSDNISKRVLKARAVAAYIMHRMGMSTSQINRRSGEKQFNYQAAQHWRRRVVASDLMDIAESLMGQIAKSLREAA